MADYFSHDYGARNDPKLVKLQMELGHEGKGLFWDLIEILYEQGGYIENTELNGIAFGLHTNYERITKVLSEYDLFKTDGQAWWSESVMKRLNIRADKSEKARESVLKRWEKYKRNTDVKQTNNKCNTIKERKGKEIKEMKVYELESIQTRTKDFKDITNYKNCQLYEYNELNDEFKKLYTESEWSAWKRFNKHLDDNCEYIRKIENQIKLKDYILIKKDFIDTKKITVNGFLDLLDTFNNYKPATDKYNSVYPALRGWLKNEIK